MKTKSIPSILAGLSCVGLCAITIPANAAVLISGEYNTTSSAYYTVSDSDLINYNSTALLSVSGDASGTRAAVTNGVAGDPSNATSVAGTDYMGYDYMNYSVTYTFDLSSNPLGFDITSINTYTGSSAYRVNQYYDIYVQSVGGGFTLLSAVSYAPLAVDGFPANASVRVSLTDSSGILAAGVQAIRFDFKQQPIGSPANLGARYREIDVFGTAAIPEPGTMGLLLLGAVGTLLIRRRQAI